MSYKLTSPIHKLYKYIIILIPKNLISKLISKILELKLPTHISTIQIKLFIYLFTINIEEINKPLHQFISLQDIFTRKLKHNARKINISMQNIISPCDGFLIQSGNINNNMIMKIKHQQYNLYDMIGDNYSSQTFNNGYFITLYLAPYSYHRFHMPINGYINKCIYIPGNLWPVDSIAIKNIKNLLCQNERIIIFINNIKYKFNHTLAIIAIGATLVGKIKINFDNYVITNKNNIKKHYKLYNKYYAQGEEIGRFEFGSILMLISSHNFFIPHIQHLGHKIHMGQIIGITK